MELDRTQRVHIHIAGDRRCSADNGEQCVHGNLQKHGRSRQHANVHDYSQLVDCRRKSVSGAKQAWISGPLAKRIIVRLIAVIRDANELSATGH
jgi:hypothetical protein